MHEVEISVDELAHQLQRVLWHMDEPIAGPGVFPQMLVCDLAARAGVPVVLGGQGGDELFGGYLRHRALYAQQRMRDGSMFDRVSGSAELARLAAREWRRVRRTSTRVQDVDLAPDFLDLVDPMLREEVRRGTLAHKSVRELMWHDLRAYLPALLHVEDRTSMAASIESRTPLLDYRLVEASLRIPTHYLFAAGEPKPLLRRAVADWLPASVVNRRDKKGFPTPLHWWKERPALRDVVLTLAGASGAPQSLRETWNVPTEAAGGAVFSDTYLSGVASMQPSELWTLMSVNGWLAQLDAGAYAHNNAAGSASFAA
jgi:asparagine synthase (glutamine-hydrolysing)